MKPEAGATKTGRIDAPRPYSGLNDQYINGAWRPGRSGVKGKDTDPYTSETIAEIALADQSDLDEAYQAAAKAQPIWAAALPADRAAILLCAASIMEARREEIVSWLIRESGSARVKSQFEWELTHAVTLEASSFPHRAQGRIIPIDDPCKESRVYRRPVGVVGVISPWNFPLYLSQRAVGPALALGNAVVLKPSADTPVAGGLLLAKIFEEAGLPPGLLNIVVGSSSEIGDAFISNPIPRVISFTGSTAVGRRVAELAAKSPIIKRVMLELGGNTPTVVLDDADLDQAARAAVIGRFLHQGQICMSTNRIIVDESVSDEFEERFTAQAKTLKYGNPNDADTVIGPIINSKQFKRLMGLIESARGAGARELLGGKPQGLVVPPHVFADVTNDMEVARNELFGPVAPIIKVKGEEEALRVANDTEYGLSSAVISGDTARGLRFALRLEVGMTHINGASVDDKPNCPFGGEKNSGIGRFGSDWVIQELTTDHWVTVQHAPRAYPF